MRASPATRKPPLAGVKSRRYVFLDIVFFFSFFPSFWNVPSVIDRRYRLPFKSYARIFCFVCNLQNTDFLWRLDNWMLRRRRFLDLVLGLDILSLPSCHRSNTPYRCDWSKGIFVLVGRLDAPQPPPVSCRKTCRCWCIGAECSVYFGRLPWHDINKSG